MQRFETVLGTKKPVIAMVAIAPSFGFAFVNVIAALPFASVRTVCFPSVPETGVTSAAAHAPDHVTVKIYGTSVLLEPVATV